MHILDQILEYKRKLVKEREGLFPVKLLEKSIYFNTNPVSLKRYLLRKDRWGIIAEIKRKSPSQGVINHQVSIERISIGYMQAGASALSVLTDEKFFGGSNDDLSTAREFNFCPILRKDFIISEYQILEAKSIGADAILLIAAALEPAETRKLAEFAHSIKLEVLLEVHHAEELESHLNPAVDMVGVNNRNLKNFNVSIDTSLNLADKIPANFIKVSESGLSTASTIFQLKDAGFQGFLIGQTFMEQSSPEIKCREFIAQLKNYSPSPAAE